MKSLFKKLSFEDKFARKFYCNAWRFIKKMKRRNRRTARRAIKQEVEE